MAITIKSSKFIETAINIANNYKTLYVMGCFGAPMNDKNKKRYTNNNKYNKKAARTKMIMAATDDTFGFDCVCLIKGIIWGWKGDKNLIYGGSVYPTKAMIQEGYCPDFGTEGMKDYCTTWSTDFSNIIPGEVLYMKGHAGIYIGNGLAVECTPAWENKVQITAVQNIAKLKGYNNRKWTAHGKLKYIEYEKAKTTYTVKGDTLQDIANKYCISVDLLKEYNDIPNDRLYVGQELVIPEPREKYTIINAKSGVWSRLNGYGLDKPKYKVIPYKTKCVLLQKDVGTKDGYNWDKIIYEGKECYLPNKWSLYE